MGFGSWLGDRVDDATDVVNDGADWVEGAVENGTEWVGERLDDGSEVLGSALDHVGWESAADWVEDRGDDAADALGADVAEQELGQTEDPKELVHGEVERITELSTRLTTFSGHMSDASSGLGAISAAGWGGSAADGFEATLNRQPGKWDAAATACSEASGATSDFATAVSRAQDRAQVAIDRWKQGVEASERAEREYNDRVDDYNAKRHLPEGERPDRPGKFTDPGVADREAAQEILDDARRARDEAGATATSTVTSATAEAPEEPEFTEEASGTLADLSGMADVWETHLSMGALKGVTGLVGLARTLNPTDPWNLRNPAAYVENLSNLANGLVNAANDPWGTLSNMFSKFTTDPAEALGELIPELIGAKGLGKVGSLRRLDDVPRRPVGPHGLREYDGSAGQRDLPGQMEDPSYHPSNRDIIDDDYDYLGGERSPEEFLDKYRKTDEDGDEDWDWPPSGDEAVPGTTRRPPPDEVPPLDRIGGGGGTYFGREGDPFGARSLPPDRLNFSRHDWTVNVDHPELRDGTVYVRESQVAEAFGQPGGGMQYEFVRVGDDGGETVLKQWQLDEAEFITERE